MSQAQKAQLDRDIAPPELKEETIDRQNAEQMRALSGMQIGPKMPRRRPIVKRGAGE